MAIAVFVLDRVHKWVMLDLVDIAYRPPIVVTPFFDMRLVWNRGISYGLFQQEGWIGQAVLILIAAVATVVLLVWLWSMNSRLAGVAIGLIAGGAAGNGIDRMLWGAVADFFHFHAFGYSWYVFNIADVAIVAGVIGLLYDSLRPSHNHAGKEG
ncbi:signal peptidase II [Lutibaculum baratangense]|uniref:Lipoprotein signal peptidase n=1 Tax=Lutibaculum baratangense AMV1 TaxID=631454 RepID=V4RWV9_9HYPH|nr:signal peptidase II [Lutibaculum baratangense]ESR27495.1 Lipoprotein signal peptidase [Lutibaculum baratangense AMV1]